MYNTQHSLPPYTYFTYSTQSCFKNVPGPAPELWEVPQEFRPWGRAGQCPYCCVLTCRVSSSIRLCWSWIWQTKFFFSSNRLFTVSPSSDNMKPSKRGTCEREVCCYWNEAHLKTTCCTFNLLLVLREVVGAAVRDVCIRVRLQGDAVRDAGQQLVQTRTRRQAQVLELPVLTVELQVKVDKRLLTTKR